MTKVNPLDRFILWIAGFFGEKSKEVERFLKFAIVGGIGAMVDFATLNVVLFLVKPVSMDNDFKVAFATGTAFCAAVLSNFIWNRYWTYPDSRSRSLRRQLVQFFVVSMAGLLFRLIFVSTTYVYLGDFSITVLDALGINTGWGTETIYHLGTNEATALSIIIVMFWNFFANRYWTYNDIE
jgi:putative flippase GtrA